jgi:ankyrin repeat protein
MTEKQKGCFFKGCMVVICIFASRGYEDVVKTLLRNGARVTLRNADGKTAWMYAVEYEHPEIAQIWRDAGAIEEPIPFHDKDKYGPDPLSRNW